jgi:class 3 adenylate cyclase/tetratricopeptide (TPR) repeat protein
MSASLPSGAATEHRFLSVLFCDLVDSTGHQYRMEPEDFAGLLSTYRRLVFEIIRRHGGHVARVIGDGVLAYFGWPRGTGRDAEAAVACALAIGARIERLGRSGELPANTKVAVRIAVETGWVLVGNVGQTGRMDTDRLEQGDVVGHAPNVAARLQRLAPHNGVVVGEMTLPLLGGHFDLESVDTSDLQLPAPVQAARVIGRSSAAKALRWLDEGRVGPLVGRDQESKRLMAYWEEAKAGRGQVVLVSGDPGIGKSHLTASVVAAVTADACEIVLTCSAANADTVLYPVLEELRLAMGLTVNAPPDAISAQADRLSRRFDLANGAAALASALGVATPAMTPAALRQAIFRTLLDLAMRVASDRPLLLLVEDLQWADASTLALLGQLSDRLATARILLVATHRADWQPALPSGAHMHAMTLTPLPTAAAAQLVEALAGELLDSVKATIVERSEGNPFFVQEFAHAMSGGATGQHRLPGSISQLLAARLDSAGSARELVQYASVVGREIEPDLMADLSGLPPDALRGELDRLLELGIMTQRGHGDTARFTFRHALLADAAYEALTTSRRQALHRQVADALRVRNPAISTSEPEVLGRHLAMAGDAAAAADLYHAAGTNALGAAAFVETASHARRSLELTRTLTGEAGQRAMLAATVLLGEALSGTQGYASDEVRATFEAANRIALELGSVADMQPALRGLTAYYQIRGPLHRAHELGRRTVQVARIAGDQLQLAEAERRWGWCMFCQGQLDEARLLIESAMRRLERFNATRQDDKVIDDTAVRGPVVLALIAWLVDGNAEALSLVDEMAASAETFPRPMTAVYGLCFASFVQQLCGRTESAHWFASRAGEIALSRSHPYWMSLTEIVRGWSEVLGGTEVQTGLERIRLGLREYERTQSTILYPYALMLLAEAEDALGSSQAALDALQRGLECAESIGAGFYTPLLETVRGRILLRLDAAAGRDALAKARAAAVRQGAVSHVRRIDAISVAAGVALQSGSA